MTDLYNQATAIHYASYRPALHQIILRRVLSDRNGFQNGLDIGCGTGYSAMALAEYCHHVYGIEPSQSMLDKAIPHEKITYLGGSGAKTSLADRSVDIVTLAGSLFYAKSRDLVEELKRVCLPGALVVPYDFEILLDEILHRWGIRSQEVSSDYDHAVNFSDIADFVELVVGCEPVNIELSVAELAHVLLADHDRYEMFIDEYGTPDPFPKLSSELESIGRSCSLEARTYFSMYQLNL